MVQSDARAGVEPMSMESGRPIEAALARAVVYRLLSLGFRAPTRERLEAAGAGQAFGAVAEALGRLDGPFSDRTLADAAAELTAFQAGDIEAIDGDFVRLFGHTTRGLVCACETEWGADNTYHQPQQLADITGYYLAFGLTPAAGSDVRTDHVACECEFMDFLNRKEALFLADRPGDSETLEATRNAARSFLRDHLGRFGRAFAARLMAEDAGGYFGVLGQVLRALLDAECRRLDIEIGPVDLIVRPEVPDDTPMACGSADSCGPASCGASDLIQIQRRS